MNVVVRLKPEWYIKLFASARPRSKADVCLRSAVRQEIRGSPESEYVLRCDEHTIALVAALADVVCPEAIPAMLTAYRAAKRAV